MPGPWIKVATIQDAHTEGEDLVEERRLIEKQETYETLRMADGDVLIRKWVKLGGVLT